MTPMLERFPGFHTKNPEVNREILFANFNVSHFDCQFREQPFVAKANWVDTKYVRVTSAFCSTSTDITYDAAPVVRQFLQARPRTHITFNHSARSDVLSASNTSVVIPAGSSFRGIASGEHGVVALRIEIAALRTVISAMLGEDIPAEQLNTEAWTSDRFGNSMRAASIQFISDLDSVMEGDSFAAEVFGQALLVRLLMSCSVRFGPRLKGHVSSPSLNQLRRVESYLAAHWQKNIDIKDIADEFGMSVRSIFRYFRSLRGVSPNEFMRQLRLESARSMLEAAEESDTVMMIAIRCGFQSMGHFARAYRTMYGESPSQTLFRKRSRTPDASS
jgi:AraC-like DNA-binding protein